MGDRRRLLFIGPLPDPVTGHSLACQVLLDALFASYDVTVVNLSKQSLTDGFTGWSRVREIGRVLRAVRRARAASDVIYVTIANSVAGNLRDLAIYALCRRRLERMVIHLHGAAMAALVWDPHPWLRWLNAACLSKVGAAIVLGPSQVGEFAAMMPAHRVHVVPNFAADDLFVPPADIDAKFATPGPLRLLYLSNLMPAKGYLEAVEAYRMLPAETRARVTLTIAGHAESPAEVDALKRSIAGIEGLQFVGVVRGDAKRRLLADSHVVVLPSALPEGQPLVILEAYAAGCVVLTSTLGGIPDVFTDGVHGFAMPPRSSAAMTTWFARMAERTDDLAAIAHHNRAVADVQYRPARYQEAVARVLSGVRSMPQTGGSGHA